MERHFIELVMLGGTGPGVFLLANSVHAADTRG